MIHLYEIMPEYPVLCTEMVSLLYPLPGGRGKSEGESDKIFTPTLILPLEGEEIILDPPPYRRRDSLSASNGGDILRIY